MSEAFRKVHLFSTPDISRPKSTTSISKAHALDATLENMSIDNKKILREIAHQEAEEYFADGEAILAACAELAISSTESAVIKLIRANELFMAYYVAKTLKVAALDQISWLLGMRSEKLHQFEQAGFYYSNCRNPRVRQLYIARNKFDYTKGKIKSQAEYLKLAAESKGPDAIFYYVMGGNLDEACKLAIERTKSKLYVLKFADRNV